MNSTRRNNNNARRSGTPIDVPSSSAQSAVPDFAQVLVAEINGLKNTVKELQDEVKKLRGELTLVKGTVEELENETISNNGNNISNNNNTTTNSNNININISNSNTRDEELRRKTLRNQLPILLNRFYDGLPENEKYDFEYGFANIHNNRMSKMLISYGSLHAMSYEIDATNLKKMVASNFHTRKSAFCQTDEQKKKRNGNALSKSRLVSKLERRKLIYKSKKDEYDTAYYGINSVLVSCWMSDEEDDVEQNNNGEIDQLIVKRPTFRSMMLNQLFDDMDKQWTTDESIPVGKKRRRIAKYRRTVSLSNISPEDKGIVLADFPAWTYND